MKKKSQNIISKLIQVKGLVQGVGFRPFIYRIALKNNIKGWVVNRNDGVIIHAEANKTDLNNFINQILTKAPLASNIASISQELSSVENFKDFQIRKSDNTSEEITDVCPDIAVCHECLSDLKTQQHRIDYPFINCTNCGPRFTIIKDLPYDREMTTMKEFIMCDHCQSEYTDILDRRFHAQPVACNTCGPHYSLHYKEKIINEINTITLSLSKLLESGKLIAIKGLGGYHLCCNPFDEVSVNKLREIKNRDGKPFALMFKDLKELEKYIELSEIEKQELSSWRRPILLLKRKQESNNTKSIAHGVCVGFSNIGVMLPYMPFHHLLFENLDLPAIVLTSGNISDEPIIISDQEAHKVFGDKVDAIVTYNREIHNRTDDSVCFVENQKERIIRRSRGYVPNPINLKLNTDGIIAAGAELVNCFCIGKGNQAILSQHIGDLKNLETLEFYSESMQRLMHLFRMKPELAVSDLHPDYLSTQHINQLGIPVIRVQHHHAHIASVMAEFGLDEKIIGIAFDGVGLGTDNKVWGGEFLLCDLADFERPYHFEYIPMPGGDKATEEPWRMALSYLYKYFGDDLLNIDIPFIRDLSQEKSELIIQALKLNLNCPETSSAGRLFDAVSALTGVCRDSTFHAEAPMRLEAAIDFSVNESYSLTIENDLISFRNTFNEIIQDILSGRSVHTISTKFHNTIISTILEISEKLRDQNKVNKVVLSGGSFQNRYILRNAENLLRENGFEVFSPLIIPANDGGIALGQLAIAAKRRSKT